MKILKLCWERLKLEYKKNVSARNTILNIHLRLYLKHSFLNIFFYKIHEFCHFMYDPFLKYKTYIDFTR